MEYINTEKIEKIQLKSNNFYVAIDFDRTITSEKGADSWDAVGNKLGKDFYKKINELYKKYRPIEVDYKIPFEEKNRAMERWYHECMELYYEYHLTKEKLEKLDIALITNDILFYSNEVNKNKEKKEVSIN